MAMVEGDQVGNLHRIVFVDDETVELAARLTSGRPLDRKRDEKGDIVIDPVTEESSNLGVYVCLSDNFISRLPRLCPRLFNCHPTGSLCSGFALRPKLIHFFLSEVLNSDERVRGGGDPNQFIKLCLDSRTVSVLRILNQEHHQERDDGRTCVNDKLPRV
jgi:hypothetical protein